jgi:cysteinyl-tRNA synthetase
MHKLYKNIIEGGVMDFSQQSADQEITELIHKREKARAAGNWLEADIMRQQLIELGVDILDTPQGAIWRFK